MCSGPGFGWQVEVANLDRSYRRAPKGAGDKSKKESEPGGICHLCKAGLKDFDWEDESTVLVSLFGVAVFLF